MDRETAEAIGWEFTDRPEGHVVRHGRSTWQPGHYSAEKTFEGGRIAQASAATEHDLLAQITGREEHEAALAARRRG